MDTSTTPESTLEQTWLICVSLELTIRHLELVDSLKQGWGLSSRSEAIQSLLDELMDEEVDAPGNQRELDFRSKIWDF